MKNPWTRKNPFLSMWLSGANTVMNTARGHAMAQARRETSNLVRQATQQTAKLWSDALTSPSPPKARRKKRR